jgi:hypothetical protein
MGHQNKNSLFLFLLFIFLIGLSFFFYFQTQKTLRKPASKEEIFSDFISKELREKTLALFNKYSFAEDISDFVIMGNLFEGTSEYGRIYLKNQEDLKKNPFLIFFAIKEQIKNIPGDDYYLRGRLMALVDKLEIPAERKVEFFGEQIIRKVEFDNEGFLTEDSKNIAESMAFFRQYAKVDSEVLKYANEALELNKDDKKAQGQLISRFKIYFPSVAKDLRRP